MAISDLGELLKNMEPKLVDGKYYLATVEESKLIVLSGYLNYLLAVFREDEGLTVVFTEEIADNIRELAKKPVSGSLALITLTVESDLMAVGFLARVTEALAKEKISVNAFSAFFHDHLLVPYERKNDALKVLKALSGK